MLKGKNIMICFKCNANIADGAKFCPECGFRLLGAAVTKEVSLNETQAANIDDSTLALQLDATFDEPFEETKMMFDCEATMIADIDATQVLDLDTTQIMQKTEADIDETQKANNSGYEQCNILFAAAQTALENPNKKRRIIIPIICVVALLVIIAFVFVAFKFFLNNEKDAVETTVEESTTALFSIVTKPYGIEAQTEAVTLFDVFLPSTALPVVSEEYNGDLFDLFFPYATEAAENVEKSELHNTTQTNQTPQGTKQEATQPTRQPEKTSPATQANRPEVPLTTKWFATVLPTTRVEKTTRQPTTKRPVTATPTTRVEKTTLPPTTKRPIIGGGESDKYLEKPYSMVNYYAGKVHIGVYVYDTKGVATYEEYGYFYKGDNVCLYAKSTDKKFVLETDYRTDEMTMYLNSGGGYHKVNEVTQYECAMLKERVLSILMELGYMIDEIHPEFKYAYKGETKSSKFGTVETYDVYYGDNKRSRISVQQSSGYYVSVYDERNIIRFEAKFIDTDGRELPYSFR